VDLEIDLSTARTFNKVVLYPRSDAGWGGAGFPIDFSIQVWDGANWVTRLSYLNYVQSYSNYVQPDSQPQIFTWTPADTTDKVRIQATALRAVESGYYYMQLAEIELYNN
jgi:hypothetical protein